jgi:hypothetical protein
MAKQIIIKGTPVVAANEVLVADSNSKIPAVDGSAVTAMAGGNIAGTIPTARLDTGTTANKVVVIGATGLPAVDGSLLTGIVSHTTSASNPTISTNPSGGVGSEWINSTSGKQFILTDATAGANVWTCSGAGSGDVQPWSFGGVNYGWLYGGYHGPAARTYGIDQISFTSDGNATDVGNMTVRRDDVSGCSSATHGYALGGYEAGITRDIIDRAPFASGGEMADVGNMVVKRKSQGASSSETYGYLAGGYLVAGEGGAGNYNEISRFQFAASANAVDIGDLSHVWKDNPGACSDPGNSYAYVAGGGNHTHIDRYAMASSASGTDVGDTTAARGWLTGHSSDTYGYTGASGPGGPDAALNRIEKFAFSSSTTTTDIGDMVVKAYDATGLSSTTYGYIAGGYHGSNNIIEKFSMTTDGNSTDVGDMTVSITYMGSVGSQY